MKKRISHLLTKLAAQEQKFFASDFLSPVIQGKNIRVLLSGVVVNLKIIEPKKFEGWGIFRPINSTTAKFLREPNLSERNSYLELFPSLRLIVAYRHDNVFFGIPANLGDSRFKINGTVPINLAHEVQLFDTVITRFDGENCWFDRIDSSSNLKNSMVLRDALAQEVDIAKITSSGLTKEEKQAYVIAFIRDIENKKDRNEERIKDAIQKAGGEYRSYLERDNHYTIEYVVDGQTHKSVVKKDTLEIHSAGICLSGGDRAFDLQSLVGVIREGINHHSINRVSLNNEDD